MESFGGSAARLCFYMLCFLRDRLASSMPHKTFSEKWCITVIVEIGTTSMPIIEAETNTHTNNSHCNIK